MKKLTVFIISIMLAFSVCPAVYADEQPEAVAPQNTVRLYTGDISAPSGCWYAWTWGESSGRWVSMTSAADGQISFTGMESNMVFACMYAEGEPSWDSTVMWKQTVDLSCDGLMTEFVITGISSEQPDKLTGFWRVYNASDETLPTEPTSFTEPLHTETMEPQINPPADTHSPTTEVDDTTQPPAYHTEPPHHTTPATEPKPTESTVIIENTEKATANASLNLSTATVKCGKVITLKIKNKGSKKVTFKSSNKAVAKVSSKGKVSALKRGFAKITATVGKKKLYFTIKVTSSPKLSKTSVTVKKGRSVTIKITGKASTVKNNYADTKYARITSKRTAYTVKIVGKKRGSTKLRVRVNGVLFKIKVKVK